MKNLIYQSWYDYETPIYDINKSINNFKKYAQIHGVDYEFNYGRSVIFDVDSLNVTQKKKDEIKYAERYFVYFDMFNEKYDDYDNILYMDTDVLIEDYTHNIFNYHKHDVSYVADDFEIPGWYIHGTYDRLKEIYNIPSHKDLDYFLNYNTVIFSKEARKTIRNEFESPFSFISKDHFYPPFGDEPYWMIMFLKHNFKINYIDRKWNYIDRSTRPKKNRFGEIDTGVDKIAFRHYMYDKELI